VRFKINTSLNCHEVDFNGAKSGADDDEEKVIGVSFSIKCRLDGIISHLRMISGQHVGKNLISCVC
jgi:hypothetical protein